MIESAIWQARATLQERRLGLQDLCAALGVPASQYKAVRVYGTLGAVVGVLPIQRQQSGLFDIVEDGQLAVIIAAYGRLDCLPTDLVAVRLDTPHQSCRYTGVADALGEPEICRARNLSCPLLKSEPGRIIVHETTINWLQSGCEGCVILDIKRTPRTLSDIDEVIPSPPTFAQDLHQLLRQIPAHLPSVMVPGQESLAA